MKTHDKPIEVWFQDSDDPQLWHGEHGVILNTAALEERTYFFDLLRVPPPGDAHSEPTSNLSLG